MPERVGWDLKVENINSRHGELLKEQEFHGNKTVLSIKFLSWTFMRTIINIVENYTHEMC